MYKSVLALALAASGASAKVTCPGSDAWVHASAEVTVSFASTTCDAISTEMKARVSKENGWVDPHNGGTYTLTSSSSTGLAGTRATGDGKYTDKFAFELETVGSGCKVTGCSESQVTSIADFSTNYCNLHDLYCGSQDGCSAAGASGDFKYTETDVDTSIGASSDKNACIGKSTGYLRLNTVKAVEE